MKRNLFENIISDKTRKVLVQTVQKTLLYATTPKQ